VSQQFVLPSLAGLGLPELGPIVQRSERAGVHTVDVKRPIKVIDFVLQNAGMSAGRRHRAQLTAFIEILSAGRENIRSSHACNL
jgi:hypothetical protein